MYNKKPLVSVLINTKNSEEWLDVCLSSVKNQSYKNVELIVVDNYSIDKTKEIAKKYTKNFYSKGPERSAQKNYGIKLAKGDFVLFVDSDQELPRELIEECVKRSLDKNYDAVLIEDNGIGTTFWAKTHAFEKAIHFGDKEVTSPRFINRKKLLEMGGFDEKLIFNEDLDLHTRMVENKFKIGHTNLLFNHYEGGNLSDVLRKNFYYGTTARQFFKKNLKRGIKLYLLYHPITYIKNWKYFLKHPVYGSASVIRKLATYVAGGAGLIYTGFDNNLELKLARSIFNKNPSYLILYVTSKCNSKCSYCFYWRELNKKKKELSLEEIEKLTENFRNLLYVSLTGGEPFLREDIDKIAYSFYKNSGTKFLAIPTNGILSEKIKEKVESMLRFCPNLNLSIEVSLDALGNLHDKIRGVKGNFNKAVKTLEYLRDIKKQNPNLRLVVHTVFSAYNQNNIKELYDYIKNFGIDQYRVGLIRKDSKIEDATKIDFKKYYSALKYINENKIKSKGYSKLFSEINKMNREVNLKTLKENRMILPCVAGKKMIVIGEEGDVYPCEILNKKFGNIRDYNYNIKKLLNSKEGEKLRDFIVKSKCFCTWGCATQNNIIFNMATYPKLFYRVLR